MIQRMADLNLAGAVIYDALTFNVDDYRRLWPEGAAKIAAP